MDHIGPSPHCEECEDREPQWDCDECEAPLCDICWELLHRKGVRASHKKQPFVGKRESEENEASVKTEATLSNCEGGFLAVAGGMLRFGKNHIGGGSGGQNIESNSTGLNIRRSLRERAKYIPLRLSMDERRYLRLLESILSVSDYTGEVDRAFRNSSERSHRVLKQISAFLSGTITALDYKTGLELLQDKDYLTHLPIFQDILEIGRRHKIMNPEKMRTEYGKLVYLMQDASYPEIRKWLGSDNNPLHLNRSIKSVYLFLEEKGGLELLDDPLIEIATREVLPDKNLSRASIQRHIKKKEKAVVSLKKRHSSPTLSMDDIHLCLYSACDNDSFLNSNCLPIDKMIGYLEKYFSPEIVEDGYSLTIHAGEDGARLTHSHERHYYFTLQSLILWREIMNDMFRLWWLAEQDLLSETEAYTLKDTGQGMQRQQQCPRTYKAMQEILYYTQKRMGTWIGSCVIHLGDHNVPNSLIFIDKYMQIPLILNPIVMCLTKIEELFEDDQGVKKFVTEGYGGLKKLIKDILHDFFRSAFDGSGADNFFDAGSCVDGRLTSAWNWCSQLATKPFAPIFKLCGVQGFDGNFEPGWR
eukprot:69081_1